MLIYLTGGKTLGHITPLINIYKYFKDKHEFIYVGLNNSLEETLCKENNIKFIGLNLKGLNRKNMLKNFEVFSLLFKSKKTLKEEITNEPDIVIASSGFVSIPLLHYSKKKKIKYYLLEQNATLGLVNKLFLSRCDKLFLSLPIDKNVDKAVLSGNFVISTKSNYDNVLFYTKKPKILMFFGSMGSSNLYEYFMNNENLFSKYEVFIVIPDKFYDKYDYKIFHKLKSINNINNIFNRFNILICRAGATTIAEVINSKIDCLLIPSPNVVNNHQFKNASLMQKNYLMDYIEEKDLNNIEDKINNIKKYNNIDNRINYYTNNAFDILNEYLNDC